MAGKRILVPFNFTDYDEKALHFVIRTYAGQKWVKVALFHVYTPPPALDGYSNPAVGRLKGTMASMWTEVREKEQVLKKVKSDLMENGFADDQVEYVFRPKAKSIGGEIVDMAQSGTYDTIVLARKPGKATRAFTRNVHDALLSSLKNTEIIIIT